MVCSVYIYFIDLLNLVLLESFVYQSVSFQVILPHPRPGDAKIDVAVENDDAEPPSNDAAEEGILEDEPQGTRL